MRYGHRTAGWLIGFPRCTRPDKLAGIPGLTAGKRHQSGAFRPGQRQRVREQLHRAPLRALGPARLRIGDGANAHARALSQLLLCQLSFQSEPAQQHAEVHIAAAVRRPRGGLGSSRPPADRRHNPNPDRKHPSRPGFTQLGAGKFCRFCRNTRRSDRMDPGKSSWQREVGGGRHDALIDNRREGQ
jgi:hypothetical protein